MYAFGAPGFVVYPHFFKPFTPYTLLFTTFVFLLHQDWKHSKIWLSFGAVCCIGFASEVIGVKTGFIFGEYYYGNALGYKLWGVPLVISLNWALLATASLIIANRFFKNSIIVALLAAVIATGIDVLIEQVAPRLDFWYFKGGLAGLHNYLGWLIIAFVAGILFNKTLGKGNFKHALLILALQLYFFGIIFFLN
jgi:bisanhydrobacterioruberin hydratase